MDKLEELLKLIQNKIEEIIKPLIEKLPLKKKSLKNDESDDEEGEDDTEVMEVSEVTQNEIDSDQEEEDDEEGLRPSREERIQQIREIAPKAILGLILIYLVIDQFILTDDPQDVEKTKVVQKKPPRKKSPKPSEPQKKAKSPEVTKVEPEPKKLEPIKTEDENTVSTVENKKDAPTSRPAPREEKAAKAEGVPPETSVDLVVKKTPEPEAPAPVEEPIKEEKIVFDNLTSEENEQAPKKEEEADKLGEKLDSIVKEIKPSKTDDVVGYVAPPSYQRFGRGLVYNCLGQHWACVDQYSYIKCRENNKYNLDNNNKQECVIKNVYASDDDCIKVQKYYVSNNEPTSFCASPEK